MPTKKQQKILSQTWEDWKTAKNGFPKLGKNEKQRKTAFPNLGRTKNSEKQLSQTWEERKTLQAEFPTPWKPKNAENQLVARERNAKNEKKQAVAKKTEPRKSFV